MGKDVLAYDSRIYIKHGNVKNKARFREQCIFQCGSLNEATWRPWVKGSFFFFFSFRNSRSFYLFIYLFIYGCVESSFLCEGFLQLWQVGTTLHRGAQASHYRGPSRRGAQAPDAQAQ